MAGPLDLNSARAPSATPAAALPSRIGRFHILRELGRGAIGSVYLAHDPVIDREVAIKTFSPRVGPHEKKRFARQFINEARAAGRLSHPHIVTIFDASSEAGGTYVAMEYLPGRELSALLDQKQQIAPDDTATLIWKIADALAYAHRNGVVHRDIKPANIFVTDDLQPKLVDFGIARAPNRLSDHADQLQEPEAPYTLFRDNLLGTPHYMSPEQALSRPADARTDIYSLGAVMYEMLAQSLPFQSKDTTRLLHQIVHKLPTPPHEIDPQVPEVLSRIAMKAMSKLPEKRYQRAEDMALDLKRYLMKEKRERQRLRSETPAAMDSSLVAALPSRQQRTSWLGWAASLVMVAALALAASKLMP